VAARRRSHAPEYRSRAAMELDMELGQATMELDMELGHGASPKSRMSTGVLCPLHFCVQFWTDVVKSGKFWPDSSDLGGGLVTVGAETSPRERLARDADRARFGYENLEHAGWENKFGGACKKNCRSDEFAVSVPRIFTPNLQTDGYFAVPGYLEGMLELL
jgi:hypothetical protein